MSDFAHISDVRVCPCCGQPIPPRSILVDREARGVVVDGQYVRLSRVEFRIFQELFLTFPEMTSVAALMRVLWNPIRKKPKGARSNIKTYVNRLRGALLPVGVIIENVRGEGYRLHLPTGVRNGVETRPSGGASPVMESGRVERRDCGEVGCDA